MKVLVLGGTGTVGSLVVAELLARRVDVRVMTRSADNTSRLPDRVEVGVGDLRDPYSARPAFQNADAVFMLNAAGVSEAFEGLMGVFLASQNGVRRFVYMSTHRADLTPFLPVGGGTKLAIENAVRISGIPYTILRPNNFYQNDRWYKDAMLHNAVYPQPIGFKGMSRVDARDIAEAAAIALTEEGHDGKTYNIVGPRVETGPSCAEAWSRALRKPIVYAGNDMDAFETANAFMGPALVFTYRTFYEFYQIHGLHATADDIESTASVIGHRPRALDDYAQETAPTWESPPIAV
jgi:uncharacterized protein YbjT (DUF2867 family)